MDTKNFYIEKRRTTSRLIRLVWIFVYPGFISKAQGFSTTTYIYVLITFDEGSGGQ